jgi:hypothetical protein
MKKFFVLFFSIALLTACSEDDNPDTDPVIGEWFIVEVNNVPQSDFTLSECNTNSFMTFNADGTTDSVFYTEIEGNCTAGPSTNSVWSKQVGIYTITIPIPELEPYNTLSGTIQFTADTFTFTPTLFQETTIVFKKG